jgi:hypothetical protein
VLANRGRDTTALHAFLGYKEHPAYGAVNRAAADAVQKFLADAGAGVAPSAFVDKVSDEEIQDIVITANLTPRKCLDLKTPFQAILKELGKDVEIRFAWPCCTWLQNSGLASPPVHFCGQPPRFHQPHTRRTGGLG